MENKGRVFSIEEIYERVWNELIFTSENTVAVHVRNIREKIEINPKDPKYLKVVWGIGYKIEKNKADRKVPIDLIVIIVAAILWSLLLINRVFIHGVESELFNFKLHPDTACHYYSLPAGKQIVSLF